MCVMRNGTAQNAPDGFGLRSWAPTTYLLLRIGQDLRARLGGALAARLQTGKSGDLADMLVKRNVLALNHSIIWSARSSSEDGIVRPSAFAAVLLITNSNFVDCSTGRSAGLAPLRILSTYVAAWR